ncbi:hypothetical protein GCM10011348_05490 [Marinobacterium nitratireducens]|uniref:YbaK/aminoacyl-tRNA synthetase-associated domain-containing protein n=1 Tax=Marinobacterium nitratireducens TaxID=518897 RepID=A0A918DNN6_9GAMM|nr:YbaK/EbsC family protein [Marinobacterium nitratireducens]GGO76986.1 hypothetical protein GCM10011348_05490 [Marinobacterium nitratireducens]
MPIAKTLEAFLEQKSASYSTRTHSYTPSSARAAESAAVPGHRLAKGVVLKRPDEGYLLVVLPSDYRVHLGRLHQLLDEEVCLASEDELGALFPDCFEGAIPALGEAYGLETLVDRGLLEQPEVYVESGDHQTLLVFDADTFARLMQDARIVDAGKRI